MRPVNIVLLVLAGAIGGAVVMKVAQRPRAAQVAELTAATPAESIAPVTVPAPPPPQPVTTLAMEPPVAAAPEPVDAAPAVTHAVKPVATPDATRPSEPKASRVRRPLIGPPKRVEFDHPAERSLASSGVPASTPVSSTEPVAVAEVQPSFQAPVSTPPLTPEQPKETPPVRMEPENATPAPAPVPPAPDPHTVTLNAGMLIPVRLVDSLSLERNHAGDRFAATLDSELVADRFVIAERGARVEGKVVTADRSARTLSIELTGVETSDNQDVAVQTERFDKRSEPDHAQDAAKVGAGAVIGAVIGGIAGGGKGAAIGAGVGGGAGAGDVLLTRKPVALASETRITFRLRTPVTITERRD
jgi:hypothetical protein